MKHISKCVSCGGFTMKEKCQCGESAITTKPARYGQDKYGKYRREAKKKDLQERGLL